MSQDIRLGLQEILEGTRADVSPQIPMLQMKYDYLVKALGGTYTYDEAIVLAENAKKTAADCGPFDSAFQKFAVEEMRFWQYASYLNTLHCLGRHDHEEEYRVLVEYGGESVVCTLYLEKYDFTTKHDLDTAIHRIIANRLIHSGGQSLRMMKDNGFDFVVL